MELKAAKPFIIQGNAENIPLADKSVDLVFTSPPYITARLYLEAGRNLGVSRKCEAWIEWMLAVAKECCRVSKGLVLINCAGVTKSRCYQPGPEGLLYRWWQQGGQCWRPAYWNRVGIPGSGGEHWLRADVEYVLAFKAGRDWPEWTDNTANGHPPKWGPGGEMSYRVSNGARVNQRGHSFATGGTGGSVDDVSCQSPRPSHVESAMTPWGPRCSRAGKRPDGSPNGNYFNGNGFKKRHTKSRADGSDEVQVYEPPVLANPGNLVRVKVGGGLLGSKLAHENEAPFPEKLAAWFIRGWCPPGGRVLDPFSGSGTTAKVARSLGRVGIGMDLRWSQAMLAVRRLAEPDRVEKTKRRRVKKDSPQQMPLFHIAV